MTQSIGILGGTFDPVHYGHLKTVEHVMARVPFDRVEFVVSARPPHRDPPVASPLHRYAMLKRALVPFPRFHANRIEIDRPGPSYTVWTLRALRHAHPGGRWCLMLGADQYQALPSWYQWQELMSHVHIIVLRRAMSDAASSSAGWGARITDDPAQLARSDAGWVFFCDTPLIDISATAVRACLAAGRDVRREVPAPVLDYIFEHGLYSVDKSRTHAI
ncbi:MAG: nicotinate-nucleotide adenylyltransferase [Gammaproteobacteria bacterium]|nr:nicotinate-nucleotide adenylyltransferase [Gammaproteobacteria bacterium]MDH3380322.1 nicotinate-nucleotide adenylyltransferase [Gammaproteobacteria bacterium]